MKWQWAILAALLVLGRLYCGSPRTSVHAATSLPKVTLSTDSTAPRSVEQRTGEVVTHDYAQAWADLADGLNSNRKSALDEYFAGEAKRRLGQRIADQQKTGLRTLYVDKGHRVRALFYSPDGGQMQLEDRAQLQVQVFDGEKKIYEADSAQTYLVLMTPGSDRWYVRFLEMIPAND
jgi:hypothetical protein